MGHRPLRIGPIIERAFVGVVACGWIAPAEVVSVLGGDDGEGREAEGEGCELHLCSRGKEVGRKSRMVGARSLYAE
jgi:hypothetical protein